MNNLLALAFRGIDHETLVVNILAMQPEYWLAERMLSGVTPISLALAQKKYARDCRDYTVTSVKMSSAFTHNNVRVDYTYTDSIWCSLPADHVLTIDEYKDFRKQEGFATSYSKSERCPHKIEHIAEGWNSHPSEVFQEFVEPKDELPA